MQPNPVLSKLGLGPQDRAVIIHADDIGMCQASVSAYAHLSEVGIVTSGAVMVPCPWFLSAVALYEAKADLDLGVHLTLTSEWSHYRWGPCSTRDPGSGLLDEQGYFFRTAQEAQDSADPDAAQVEMRAQVKRALAAGMHPTHLDTHMGTVAHPKFIPAYIQMAMEFHLPPMIFRQDEAGYRAAGLDPETARVVAAMVENLEGEGVPLLDTLASLPLDRPEDRLEQASRTMAALPPGLTHFIIHPSVETPELKAITPDWPSRVADYKTFCNEALRKILDDLGIYRIGYAAVKEFMPPFS